MPFGGFLMGAKVLRFSVSSSGGCVRLSKNNIFITLAPYFFPFYMVALLLAYLLAACFLDMRPYALFWWGGLGACWAFHLTFTLKALSLHQSGYSQIWLYPIAQFCLFVPYARAFHEPGDSVRGGLSIFH